MRYGLATLMTAAAALSLTVVGAATFQNIVGTITDTVFAEPAPGIEVDFYDALNAELLASTTTDAGGHYDSGVIPAGSYRVRIGSDFYGAAADADSFCGAAIVPVPASMTTVLDAQTVTSGEKDGGEAEKLVEPGGGGVAGHVVDAVTGLPLQGIRVSLLASGGAELIAAVMTDADGFYSFGALDSKETSIPESRIRFSDPTGTFFAEFYGADADLFCSATIVSGGEVADGFLDRVPPEHLTQQLAETVTSYDLPAGVATMLGTSLTQLRGLLADDNAGNDAATCRQLASFVTRVDLQERRGELTSAQADELRAQAAIVGTAVGCQ
jgi:5-hydroxyisourate hydrolase-like protein (transthyretin family)